MFERLKQTSLATLLAIVSSIIEYYSPCMHKLDFNKAITIPAERMMINNANQIM